MVRKNLRYEEKSNSIASQSKRLARAESKEAGKQPEIRPNPNAVQSLLKRLQCEQDKGSRRQAYLAGTLVLGLLVTALQIVFNNYTKLLFLGTLTNWSFIGLFVGWGLLCLVLLYLVNCASARRFKIARQLADHQDLNAIGPLVNGLGFIGGARGLAVAGLLRLLPCLKSTDADLLDKEQRITLCKFLVGQNSNPQEIKLKLEILQAFARIGYTQALSVVERLAHRGARSRAERWLPEAAQACLLALRTQQAREQANETLLRAADSAGATAGTLLRSASATQGTDPQQLLRISPGNDEAREC